MKITIKWEETFDLSEPQIEFLRRLSKRGEYLNNEDSDLADKIPGISSNHDGYYWLDRTGKRILAEIDKKS